MTKLLTTIALLMSLAILTSLTAAPVPRHRPQPKQDHTGIWHLGWTFLNDVDPTIFPTTWTIYLYKDGSTYTTKNNTTGQDWYGNWTEKEDTITITDYRPNGNEEETKLKTYTLKPNGKVQKALPDYKNINAWLTRQPPQQKQPKLKL